MKKTICFVLSLLILLSFCGCGVENTTTSNSTKTEADAAKAEVKENSPEENAEEEAIAFFSDVVNKIENGDNVVGGRIIEDLAKAYPNNVLINNYYNFFNAYYFLSWYNDISKSDDDYAKFEHYLSLVDISFDGEYKDFINDFVVNNMGVERYNELRGTSVQQDKIYRGLSDSDKVDILISVINREERYGDNISEEQYDALLKEVAADYGITSNDILRIMTDGDLLQKAYSATYEPESNESTITDYDAILVNDGYKVVIAANKAILDEFLDGVVNGNDSKINDLLLNANIAYVAVGTKVDIIDDGIAVKKIRILEGNLAGVEAYTISECVEYK